MNNEPTYYESKFDEAHNILMAATDIKKNEGCAFMMIGIDKSQEAVAVMCSLGGKSADIAEAVFRVLTIEGEESEGMRSIFHAAAESARIWISENKKKKGMLRSIFGARKQQ